MGYYTYFNIQVEPEDEWKGIYESEMGGQLLRDHFNDGGCGHEPEKWYEWEEEMAEFSRKWPNILFHLSGRGDNEDDWWTATFLNGKVHYRRAEIPPFERSLLKELD